MDNFPYTSSYPDSGNSSPRSREREIDCENASWDEPPSSIYKVKFMCSYGGKIHPRPHDNQLTYVGGHTKILAVDRNVKFSALISKLASLSDADLCFKYQLPGEDLDALISVTNDEDLEHMMLEYDRLFRGSAKPARLRLFLFSINNTPPNTTTTTFGSTDTKSERQWFVDALNSAKIQTLEDSSPPAAANPDFLFGLDKGPSEAAVELLHPQVVPAVPEVFQKEIRAGSDCGSEDRQVFGDPAEIQRQIQELQRLQIGNQEQSRAYYGDYYAQKAPENVPPPQPAVPGTMQAPYWQERYMTTGGYPVTAASGAEQPVYLIQTTSGGVYQTPAMRPVTGQVSQAYYGMQRMVPEVYREQQVFNAVPPQSIRQQRIGAYTDPSGMVRQTMGSGVGVAEQGYAQVGYDGAGRQVYYAAPGGMAPPYQAVTAAADVRQGGGPLSQEVKVVANASHTSSV